MPWNLLTKTTESDRWQSEQHQKQTLHDVLGVVVHWRVVDPQTLEESQWGTLKHMALWFWNTLILKHTASWHTQHHKTQSTLKHIMWHGTLKYTASWNTQRHETQSILKHMALWNTKYPETHGTLKRAVPWNTQYPETYDTLNHTALWNTQYPKTLSEYYSTLKHRVP